MSPTTSVMPVTTRSMYRSMHRALIAERNEKNAVLMKEIIASVENEKVTPPVCEQIHSPKSDYDVYKRNVNYIFAEHDKCEDTSIKNKIYITTIEYLLQPEMLKQATASWIVMWRASLMFHANDTKSASEEVPFTRNAIAILDGHLENDGHYNVTAEQFIEKYTAITNFIKTKNIKWTTLYLSSLVPYMIKAAAGAWKDVPLEKKSLTRARVMAWKEMEAPAVYGIVEKCNEFLEKYKMW